MSPKPVMTPKERRLAGIHRRALRSLRGDDEEAKKQARIDLRDSRAGLEGFWSRLAKWQKENPNE